jgi:hypothetical protein
MADKLEPKDTSFKKDGMTFEYPVLPDWMEEMSEPKKKKVSKAPSKKDLQGDLDIIPDLMGGTGETGDFVVENSKHVKLDPWEKLQGFNDKYADGFYEEIEFDTPTYEDMQAYIRERDGYQEDLDKYNRYKEEEKWKHIHNFVEGTHTKVKDVHNGVLDVAQNTHNVVDDVRKMKTLPVPAGGVGWLLIGIFLVLFTVVKVQGTEDTWGKGMTRFQLMWNVLIGNASIGSIPQVALQATSADGGGLSGGTEIA